MSDKPPLPQFAKLGTVQDIWEIVCEEYLALKERLSRRGEWHPENAQLKERQLTKEALPDIQRAWERNYNIFPWWEGFVRLLWYEAEALLEEQASRRPAPK